MMGRHFSVRRGRNFLQIGSNLWIKKKKRTQFRRRQDRMRRLHHSADAHRLKYLLDLPRPTVRDILPLV
jgi:hypothetical protein